MTVEIVPADAREALGRIPSSGEDSGAGGAVAARVANQPLGGGAIPTSALHVRRIPWSIARAFVREHHYLHQCSPIGRIAYGVFASDALVASLIGVVLYVVPPNLNEDQASTLEIQRLVILDLTTRNAESRVLGVTLRDVRRRFPEIQRVIAYADPDAGHAGTIYKAAGFTALGLSAPGGTTHGPERRGTPRARTRKWKFEKLFAAVARIEVSP